MRRHHSGRARGFCRNQLVEPKARDERVHVDHVGALPLNPGVEMLRAAYPASALRLVARRPGRYRISINGNAVVLVLPRFLRGGVRRDDEHLVIQVAETMREPSDVVFRAADAVWMKPADGLNDLHAAHPLPD